MQTAGRDVCFAHSVTEYAPVECNGAIIHGAEDKTERKDSIK